MNNSSFTDMDLHCIARLVQSSFQAPEQETINTLRGLYGCMYCKYVFECVHAVQQKGEPFHFQKIFKKLEGITGIRESYSPCTPDADEIGRRFFPGSYYIGHPEMVSELGKVHPEHMITEFKTCLEKLTACSIDSSSTGSPVGSALVTRGEAEERGQKTDPRNDAETLEILSVRLKRLQKHLWDVLETDPRNEDVIHSLSSSMDSLMKRYHSMGISAGKTDGR